MTYVANHTNKRCYVSCGDRCTCGGGDFLPELPNKMENRTVVRISTSFWSSNGTLNVKKSIRLLVKKSNGDHSIFEDASCVGAESALKSITNLDSVEDGVYEIVVRVLGRDFESGYPDDWEYVLYPYSG